MTTLFEVQDKSGRTIRLSKERWSHILAHSDMANQEEAIKETLTDPLKITEYSIDKDVRYYYKYYKDRNSRAKYLRVIAKHKNSKEFLVPKA
jgi:hypothetical protein